MAHDDDAFVIHIASAFRQMLAEEQAGTGDGATDDGGSRRDEDGREDHRSAVLVATGAALGDPMFLPPRDDRPEH